MRYKSVRHKTITPLGTLINIGMRRRGIEPHDLSLCVGRDKGYVSHICCGWHIPAPEILVKIGVALDINVEYLLKALDNTTFKHLKSA